jgi:diguanylate cyclase (GGDEF)-like protein
VGAHGAAAAQSVAAGLSDALDGSFVGRGLDFAALSLASAEEFDLLVLVLEPGQPPPRSPALLRLVAARPTLVLADADLPGLEDWAVEQGVHEVAPRSLGEGRGLGWALRSLAARLALFAELANVRQRYELATLATRDGIWDWNIESGEVFFSQALEQMLGLRVGALERRFDSWLARVHPSEQATLRAALERFLAEPSAALQFECRMRHELFGYRRILIRGRALLGAGGRAVRLVGSQRDVTREREREERLRHDAYHDPLTGAANRMLFRDRLAQALERQQRRPDGHCTVVIVDLDHFKPINDEYGHAAGDAVLVEVAQRLRLALRPMDTVARLGGDEFGLLLEDVHDRTVVEAVAQRLTAVLGEPVSYEGHRIPCGASLGLTMIEDAALELDLVLERADQAMYAAKQRQVPYVLWHPELSSPAALFEVHPMPRAPRPEPSCEPLVELLSRWPVGLVIGQQVGAAELRPLDPAGVEVLLELLADPARRPEREAGTRARLIDLRLSSSCVRSTSALVRTQRLLEALRPHGIHLRVALSEATWVQGGEEFHSGLGALRAAGHAVLIDGFGAVHAPLGLLRGGLADGVRVDAGLQLRDPLLLEACADFCLRRGSEFVAAGVESEEQALALLAAGCAVASGRYLGDAAGADGAPRSPLEALLRSSGGRRSAAGQFSA